MPGDAVFFMNGSFFYRGIGGDLGDATLIGLTFGRPFIVRGLMFFRVDLRLLSILEGYVIGGDLFTFFYTCVGGTITI